MAGLVEQAAGFADILTTIVKGTVNRDVRFVVTPFEKETLAWVFPAGSTPARVRLIPITSGHDATVPPRLWLRASYLTRLDSSGEHLAIEKSVFALAIDEAGRPAVRLEYDRGLGSEPDDVELGVHRRSAAHVQIHGASEEFAYALAMSGQAPRSLDEFHIPVGGRRFRPSLEDFIEFLHAERLIRLHDGWQQVIAEHREGWLRRQTQAAVRNDPGSAVEQLRAMGYRIEPP